LTQEVKLNCQVEISDNIHAQIQFQERNNLPKYQCGSQNFDFLVKFKWVCWNWILASKTTWFFGSIDKVRDIRIGKDWQERIPSLLLINSLNIESNLLIGWVTEFLVWIMSPILFTIDSSWESEHGSWFWKLWWNRQSIKFLDYCLVSLRNFILFFKNDEFSFWIDDEHESWFSIQHDSWALTKWLATSRMIKGWEWRVLTIISISWLWAICTWVMVSSSFSKSIGLSFCGDWAWKDGYEGWFWKFWWNGESIKFFDCCSN